jgi:long-chain fatty acid transport protein
METQNVWKEFFMKSRILATVLMGIGFCGSVMATSGGYSNDLSDSRSLGNGNAVVARGDSPSTNWFNPAGLSRLSKAESSVTLVLESLDVEFDSATGPRVDAEPGFFYVPSFFYASPIEGGFAYGLGVNAPYGLVTEWESPITNYVTTYASFKPILFNPNLSYAFDETFSVALGIDIAYATGLLKRNINQTLLNSFLFQTLTGTSALLISPDGTLKLEGEDVAFGSNAALLWTPEEKWSFGLSYRSSIDLKLQDGEATLRGLNGPTALVFGGSSYTVDASVALPIPATVTAGLAFKPWAGTTFEFDLEWAQWSDFDEVKVKYKGESNPVRLAVLNIGNPDPTNWNDTWNSALGVEQKISEKLTVYGGTNYRPSPIPEETFDPIVPSLDLVDWFGGFSVHSEKSRIDFLLGQVWGLSEDIDNTVGNAVGTSIDGKYRLQAFVFGVTFSHKY